MTDIQREISRKKETTLHIAAAANLTAENNAGNPALTYAAAAGNVNIAKAMLKRNIQLPNLGRMKPLYTAASLGHSRTVDWLYSDTKLIVHEWEEIEQPKLFITCVMRDLYGKHK